VQHSEAAVELSKAAFPLSEAELSKVAVELSAPAVQLFSNPAFDIKLPFPFVGSIVPKRFKPDSEDDCNWFYMGRERFVELLVGLRLTQWRIDRTAFWVYGTKGYGKSHLLAALVCYLVADQERAQKERAQKEPAKKEKKERVVYIPDCRECVKDQVAYIQAAMLSAWADDDSAQQTIMTLESMEGIYKFFQNTEDDVIFIIDQINGCQKKPGDDDKTAQNKAELLDWLTRFRANHTAILSASANYKSYLVTVGTETTEETMRVYGGLTAVSFSE
jgi:NACHT domain